MAKAIAGHRYKYYKGGEIIVDMIAKHTEHAGHMVIYHSVDVKDTYSAMPLGLFEGNNRDNFDRYIDITEDVESVKSDS